ncbi:MAG: GTP-binding protein, partial [SAR116 cluster bacterium]|nr:GTP-binding protein [SAR116 cluster bacterium]
DAEAVAAGQVAPDLAGVEAQRAADDQLDHDTPLAEVFEDQVACADLILLTKSDLAGQSEKDKARERIADVAPRPLPVIEVPDGRVDPRLLLGLEAAAEDDLAARPSNHDGVPDHDHEDFDSAVLTLPELTAPDQLTSRIKKLADEHHVLRVKGYAVVAGKPMRLLVQAVGGRVRTQFDRMWAADEPKCGRLVVIAEHDHLDIQAIEAVLAG